MGIAEVLKAHVSLPHSFTVSDVFLMLSSKTHLSKGDFVDGMTRLLTSRNFQRDCILQKNFNKMSLQLREGVVGGPVANKSARSNAPDAVDESEGVQTDAESQNEIGESQIVLC